MARKILIFLVVGVFCAALSGLSAAEAPVSTLPDGNTPWPPEWNVPDDYSMSEHVVSGAVPERKSDRREIVVNGLVLPSAIDVDYGVDGTPSSPAGGGVVLPSAIDMDYGADGNPSSQSPADPNRDLSYDFAFRLIGPVATSVVPVSSHEDRKTLEQGNSLYSYGDNRPVLSFADQEAPRRGSSSSPYTEDRPVLSFADEEALLVAITTGR